MQLLSRKPDEAGDQGGNQPRVDPSSAIQARLLNHLPAHNREDLQSPDSGNAGPFR